MVHTLRTQGQVAFVGDGVNDAAALATAQVGIAMGCCPILMLLPRWLLSDDLLCVLLAAFHLSRQTNRIIKQNLVFAIAVLVLMVLATLFWYLPLPLCVIRHEGRITACCN